LSADLQVVAATDLAASSSLAGALLALNNAHAAQLSLLDAAGLARLVGGAFYAKRIGESEAMLIALAQDARYDSPNFLWFRSRYPRFVYVDRVVVAPEARGRGHARRLYLDLFDSAARAGQDQIVCEVNQVPPNRESDAFHAAMGFAVVGAGEIDGGAKSVRYLRRRIEANAPPTVSDRRG